MFDCSRLATDESEVASAHLAPPESVCTSGNQKCREREMTSLKLTEQINTDLLCLFISFPKESVRTEVRTGFWHLTLCTLLSSQGSGAPETRLATTNSGQLL